MSTPDSRNTVADRSTAVVNTNNPGVVVEVDIAGQRRTENDE
jgi:hypothetical protein